MLFLGKPSAFLQIALGRKALFERLAGADPGQKQHRGAWQTRQLLGHSLLARAVKGGIALAERIRWPAPGKLQQVGIV